MVHSADPHRRGSRKKPRGGRSDPSRKGPADPGRASPADPGRPDYDDPGEPEYDGPAWPEPAAGTQPRGALAVSRRKLLVSGGGLAAAFAGLETMRHLAATPIRLAVDREAIRQRFPGASNLPDVQFDLSSFIAPAQTVDGLPWRSRRCTRSSRRPG
jgi:hypothetical protein